jgi:integrase/recombinase XerD
MNWSSKLILHKKELRIAVYFEKNTKLIAGIKQFEGAKWSQTLKVWHLPDNEQNRIHFKIPAAYLSFPSEEGILAIQKFSNWLTSKRYSPNTVKTYTEALKSFLVFHRELPVSEITNDHIILYNNDYILKNNLSASYPKSNCKCH